LNQETTRNKPRELILKVFEIRRAIDEALQVKEQNTILKKIKGSTRKEIDASVWNELGLYFLNNRMYLDALIVYEHMLRAITKAEEKNRVEIHKGLPLHNIGVAQINLRNYDEGIPNILKAYEEDVKTFGKTKAKNMLAHKVKEGLYAFVSKVIDNNYLPKFNKRTGLKISNTASLLDSMNEAEKLFLAKIITSKKLVSFHSDLYTKVVMFDNLRNLGLLLESNLRRRSKKNEYLPDLIKGIFSKEEWKKHFAANAKLKKYSDVKDFQEKLMKIDKLKSSGKRKVDFVTNSFLTISLMRNFTAHYLSEKLSILKNSKKYDKTFAREIFAVLYSLNYPVK
jgi:hypothetical protein